MDPPQFGESSRSPHQGLSQVDSQSNGHASVDVDGASGSASSRSRLILGNWDVPPPTHTHASHDLISLLHLDTLYNTYVRPFADAVGPDEEGVKDNPDDDAMQIDGEGPNPMVGGKRRKKGRRARLEKGYIHLIDDCIDPTPMGEHKDNLAILPLISDQLDPERDYPSSDFGPRPTMLDSLWDNARLEAGQVVDGYSEGIKKGVKENEEKRHRKRLQRQTQTSGSIPTGLPSPSLPSGNDHTPGTPFQSIAPPRPPFNLTTSRKSFVPSRPGMPGTPGTPRVRLGSGSGPTLIPAPGSTGTPQSLPPRPLSAISNKRPGEALSSVNPKRTKPVGGSRSASPMPHGLPETPTAAWYPQGRPGVGKQPRSKTEGF